LFGISEVRNAMNAVSAVTSTAASTQPTIQEALQQSAMNFAMSLVQSTRSDILDTDNKLEQQYVRTKQESGER
jgi:hypothetical protein